VLALLDAKIALGKVEGIDYHRDVQFIAQTGATEFGAIFLGCQVRGVAVGKAAFPVQVTCI
jgi:hypothetical protein